ncbi:hypothetical protein ABT235_28120 [Micromonospora echinofusca]|uniref:hypothetical protein n=1 Tax=Micromonospora echinofusca TaxID=47858 RepID=UPI00332404EC
MSLTVSSWRQVRAAVGFVSPAGRGQRHRWLKVATLARMPHFRPRARYVALLALAVTAAFFWHMATDADEPDLPTELFVVTGTVDSIGTAQEMSGSGNRRTFVVRNLVKLREHPGVEFRVRSLPGRELVPGTPVRFELREDPAPTLENASSLGKVHHRITADGFVADGTVVYTATEAQVRRDAAVKRFRSISLLLWAVVVFWIALLAWRHRVFLQSLRQPDGASAVADRLRKWVYRE